jgi:hypothetical protein
LLDAVVIYTDDRGFVDMIAGTAVVTGNSYRMQRDLRKNPQKPAGAKYVKVVKCDKCGGRVPFLEDGSGSCEQCKMGYVRKGSQ